MRYPGLFEQAVIVTFLIIQLSLGFTAGYLLGGRSKCREPVGQMDVHPNGVKAINCDLEPGLYWLVPVEGDDD